MGVFFLNQFLCDSIIFEMCRLAPAMNRRQSEKEREKEKENTHRHRSTHNAPIQWIHGHRSNFWIDNINGLQTNSKPKPLLCSFFFCSVLFVIFVALRFWYLLCVVTRAFRVWLPLQCAVYSQFEHQKLIPPVVTGTHKTTREWSVLRRWRQKLSH